MPHAICGNRAGFRKIDGIFEVERHGLCFGFLTSALSLATARLPTTGFFLTLHIASKFCIIKEIVKRKMLIKLKQCFLFLIKHLFVINKSC